MNESQRITHQQSIREASLVKTLALALRRLEQAGQHESVHEVLGSFGTLDEAPLIEVPTPCVFGDTCVHRSGGA